MAENSVAALEGLPSNVATILSAFLSAARNDLATDLISAVLFGSAADGKLGPTSDVNLLLVLRTFAPDKIRRLRDAFLTAEAAIKLSVMFVLEDELPSAAELFAQKFADMRRRHRTVFGKDVLGSLKVARQSEIFRLRQILLNLTVRLREACVARGRRPEQVARILADMLGPLRAACATLLELEGRPASDSTAALVSIAASFGPDGTDAVAQVLSAHERGSARNYADDALFQVLTLAMQIFRRAEQLT
jgi:predicted nucleotidyltransferase